MPAIPLWHTCHTSYFRRPVNTIEFVNNHAEIVIGNKRALVDLDDVEKVKSLRWSAHPRGPINERIISRNPRKKKYTLLVRLLFGHIGKRLHYVDGNQYDLRRANIIDKEYRPRSVSTRKGLNGGIYFSRGRWISQMRMRGKTTRRSFSLKKYGVTAQLLARDVRREMISVGLAESARRIREFKKLSRLRKRNERLNAPLHAPATLLSLARIYAERENLPDAMIPHLHRMLLLGGGRMPKLEHKKNLAPVNIYEGNHEYGNCVVEVERDEETGEPKGFQMRKRC